MLLALVLAGASLASADSPQVTTGLRLGWLSTTGAAREILATGAPEYEGYVDVAHPRLPLSVEASMSGATIPGTESGSATFMQTGIGTYPVGWSFAQTLIAIPLRLTLKAGPRRKNFSAHVGAGVGGVFTYVRRILSFSDPYAQAALGSTTESSALGVETHAQAGADWRIGDNLGAGLLARWSYAQSGLTLYRGFQGSNAAGPIFSESRSAGNVAGLFLGASLWWRF
ncbi:MAG: hypothetical protein ACHQ2Z_04290 [Elusimicrobiota bacterium]